MAHCASCNRSTDDLDARQSFVFNGTSWCRYCANIEKTSDGIEFVTRSSPGRIVDVNRNDPLEAWIDCFEMKPKHRILKKTAKREIQRAWALWDGNKGGDVAMFKFFGWLSRHRPYFLTFRVKGDPWQTIHSWLIQYESENPNKR